MNYDAVIMVHNCARPKEVVPFQWQIKFGIICNHHHPSHYDPNYINTIEGSFSSKLVLEDSVTQRCQPGKYFMSETEIDDKNIPMHYT